MTLRTHLAEACESIDAGVFSGDVLYSDKERAMLEEHMLRWQRAINEHVAQQELEQPAQAKCQCLTLGPDYCIIHAA